MPYYPSKCTVGRGVKGQVSDHQVKWRARGLIAAAEGGEVSV